MPRRRTLWTIVVAMTLVACLPTTGDAQVGALRRRAEEAARKKLEEAAKQSASDSAKAKAAADSAKAKAAADSAKATAADSSRAAAAQGTPTQGGAAGAPAKSDPKIWENYDFVPGSKVIFYTDFADDRVGNFARGLKYIGGPAEVVERGGVKMLRSQGRATFLIPVGRKLPERFTLEIDVLAPAANVGGYDYVAVEGGTSMDRGDKSAEVNWNTHGSLIIGGGQNAGTSQKNAADGDKMMGQPTHLRILMDSAYFKMYANEKRIYNIPELQFKRDSVIRVFVKGGEEDGQSTFITGIRVAESETDVMYDALVAKGRWVTQGILFATGKAELQPESHPVLKEIASTLGKYGDLKILIEGHTDNVGAAASNLALSDARAAAVKAALVSGFGVSADRLTTKGFGDTKPSVPNATPAGRAQNRRVEIVKQ
ncbi:MAG: OmpA family protein [Gemmatimonadota bacterium]